MKISKKNKMRKIVKFQEGISKRRREKIRRELARLLSQVPFNEGDPILDPSKILKPGICGVTFYVKKWPGDEHFPNQAITAYLPGSNQILLYDAPLLKEGFVEYVPAHIAHEMAHAFIACQQHNLDFLADYQDSISAIAARAGRNSGHGEKLQSRLREIQYNFSRSVSGIPFSLDQTEVAIATFKRQFQKAMKELLQNAKKPPCRDRVSRLRLMPQYTAQHMDPISARAALMRSRDGVITPPREVWQGDFVIQQMRVVKDRVGQYIGIMKAVPDPDETRNILTGYLDSLRSSNPYHNNLPQQSVMYLGLSRDHLMQALALMEAQVMSVLQHGSGFIHACMPKYHEHLRSSELIGPVGGLGSHDEVAFEVKCPELPVGSLAGSTFNCSFFSNIDQPCRNESIMPSRGVSRYDTKEPLAQGVVVMLLGLCSVVLLSQLLRLVSKSHHRASRDQAAVKRFCYS
jgi:hypothetical protein